MYENINVNELVREYQNGNKEVFNLIYEAEKRTIWSIIKTYYSYDKDDIKQTAMIGLLKAIDTFNTNAGIKFNSYATSVIRNEMNMFVRKNNTKNKKYEVISANSYADNDEDEMTIQDLITSDDNIEEEIIENEEHKRLYEMIDMYAEKNEMKANVIRLVVKGLKQEDIAEIVGCSRSYISRIQTAFIKYARAIA